MTESAESIKVLAEIIQSNIIAHITSSSVMNQVHMNIVSSILLKN